MHLPVINNAIIFNKYRFLPIYIVGIRTSNQEFLCVRIVKLNIKSIFTVNLNDSKHKFLNKKVETLPVLSEADINKIKQYFLVNKNNKYAVWFLVSRLVGGENLDNLIKTQFPPLDFNNPTSDIKQKIRKGDMIFSVSFGDKKNSRISNLVTKWDLSMFSHVECVLERDNELWVVGIGMEGGYYDSLEDYFLNLSKNRRIAVYRPTSHMAQNTRLSNDIILELENSKYAYRKVFLIFLSRLIGFDYTHAPTVSELLYNIDLKNELIGYL